MAVLVADATGRPGRAKVETNDSQFDAVDLSVLTPLVRAAVGDPLATVLDWRRVVIPYHAVLPGRAILRFAGRAVLSDAEAPWSLVLKYRHPPAPGAADGWEREVIAYRSGLLAALPGPLVAPRLLRTDEDASGGRWLWLEDIRDGYDRRWPLAYFGVAARHLGLFNGAYLAGAPLPRFPWLLEQWAEWHSEPWAIAVYLPEVERQVRRVEARWPLPPRLTERGPQLLRDQPRIIAALANLPKALCHNDAAFANLFARERADGAMETVAIDWEGIGPAAVGAEIAGLVFGTLRQGGLPVEQADALETVVCEGYLAGLREAGWRGDGAIVRLGYAGAVALRWSLLVSALRVLADGGARARGAERFSMTPEQFALNRLRLSTFLLDRADEARRLTRSVAL
jgi:hypothetical protein